MAALIEGRREPPATLSLLHATRLVRPAREVTLIPGEGIGPEVVAAAVRAVGATATLIHWDRVELNSSTITMAGHQVPKAVLESLQRTRMALKGPVSSRTARGLPSVDFALCYRLDLFTKLRPIRSLPGLGIDQRIDLVMFQPNPQRPYITPEFMTASAEAAALQLLTGQIYWSVTQHAFAFADSEERRKIAAIQKPDRSTHSEDLLLRFCRKTARRYPNIEYEERTLDDAAGQLTRDPTALDVVVTNNECGEILTKLVSGFVGGPELLPQANFGGGFAIFEPAHGSMPRIAGQRFANPTALLRAAVLLLQHLGEHEAASHLNAAIEDVYRDGQMLTPDLGGTATTVQFTDAVIERLPRCRGVANS